MSTIEVNTTGPAEAHYRFVVFLHKTSVAEHKIMLNDLTYGRWDLVCRLTCAALMKSKGTRRNAELVLVVPDEGVLIVDGDAVRHLRPDERNIASLYRCALGGSEKKVKGFLWLPGVTLASLLSPDEVVYLLAEGGDAYNDFLPFASQSVFVMGDGLDLTEEELQSVRALPQQQYRMSLGNTSLLASQCITSLWFVIGSVHPE